MECKELVIVLENKKYDRKDCSNYRSNSLSTTYKILSTVKSNSISKVNYWGH